ncbi:MAG: agmatine deiminase [Desulfocapsaceae bacterium]|jgi:agmatine deiminase|nr:agmatine deiminase [Desulfocapsaceae bacterium]
MNSEKLTLPRLDGFRMPGEFEPHKKCWMLWPRRPDTWRCNGVPAQKAFAAVAAAIARFEPVTVGVSRDQKDSALALLPTHVCIVEIEADDAWMRDVGPTFVTNNSGEVRGIDWRFNAWGGNDGGLYQPWDSDEQVAGTVLRLEKKLRYQADIVMEGGAFHSDGEGTVITTEECLLNRNRNPALSKKQIEDHLKNYVAAEKIIWLPQGVYMDETDGHVDNLCCFIKPGEVLLLWTDDTADPQYNRSLAAYQLLSAATDAKGRPLIVHRVHQPGPLYMSESESAGIETAAGSIARNTGRRLAASYVNFYIANGGIVMPLFNDPRDEAALRTIEKLFPEHQVIALQSREILLGGGNIHCITQQQPQGVSAV